VLHVSLAAHAGGEQFLAVGHAVVVRVGVLPDVALIGLHREDGSWAEGCHPAREDEVVHENAVFVVNAVVVGVLVKGDAADRVALTVRVRSLHVAADLENEHASVSVERDCGRLLDDRIGEHELEAVAGLENELLEFVLWALW
jgi:hypothetical protein